MQDLGLIQKVEAATKNLITQRFSKEPEGGNVHILTVSLMQINDSQFSGMVTMLENGEVQEATISVRLNGTAIIIEEMSPVQNEIGPIQKSPSPMLKTILSFMFAALVGVAFYQLYVVFTNPTPFNFICLGGCVAFVITSLVSLVKKM